MAIKYELYPITGITQENEKEKRFYPRVVCHNTRSNEDIAEKLHHRSTYTPGELIGMLESIANIMHEMISNGECVHLDGIGFFQATATCRKPIKEMNARNLKIELKDVTYRPDAKMKRAMAHATFECSGANTHFDVRSEEEWDNLLEEMFAKEEYITAKDLEMKTNTNRTAVCKRLRHWMDNGKIRNVGTKKIAIYKRCNNADK